jgi:hypothetical protein
VGFYANRAAAHEARERAEFRAEVHEMWGVGFDPMPHLYLSLILWAALQRGRCANRTSRYSSTAR